MQIFLLVNVFLIGVGVTISVLHARAHFRPVPKDKISRSAAKAVRLSAKNREKIIKEAEDTYRKALNNTTQKLVGDLEHTATRLNSDLSALGEKIIHSELDTFKQKLAGVQVSLQTAGQTSLQDAKQYQEQLKQKMQAELDQEKGFLLNQIDTKLADSMVAFLVETLQHDVDLGAQTAYLTKILDEHKDDFKRSVEEP